MAEIYTLCNPRTNNKRQFTDAKEAGAAFFNEERADRPTVIHSQEDPKAPGGRFGRFLADTGIYGTYANGEQKFVKSLPKSHTREGDAKFRAGYMEALEKSVNERLKQADWEKARPDHPMKAPNLDNKLYDDLDTLARVDDNKAIKAWKDNAPEWATPPAYADPAWNKEIAQAKRAAEFDAAQREREQAEFESLLSDDPTEKNVVSHEPEKLEGKLIEGKFRNDEVIRRENISARYKVEKYVPYSAEDTYSWSYEALPCISANTTDDQIMQLIDEIEFAANSRIGATLHRPTLAEMFTKRREVLKNLEEDESLGLG